MCREARAATALRLGAPTCLDRSRIRLRIRRSDLLHIGIGRLGCVDLLGHLDPIGPGHAIVGRVVGIALLHVGIVVHLSIAVAILVTVILSPPQVRKLPTNKAENVSITMNSEQVGKLNAKPDREDECTLCKLCLDAAPAGAVVIRKMYRDEQLISRGGKS